MFDQAKKNLHSDTWSPESSIDDSLEGICSQDHYSMRKKQRINRKYLSAYTYLPFILETSNLIFIADSPVHINERYQQSCYSVMRTKERDRLISFADSGLRLSNFYPLWKILQHIYQRLQLFHFYILFF